MLSARAALISSAALVLLTTGCGRSGLAAPFDRAKNQPITILRLQNYEPPPAPGAPPPGAPAPAQTQPMPPLPPQIQAWLGAGASLLPPGLIPPGLLGPTQPPQSPAAPTEMQRFHGFRVLGWMALTDPRLREEVLDVFGTRDNFVDSRGNCMYSEMGVSIGQPGGAPPADMLVSLSCDRVQAFNFVWPHGNKAGMGAETVKRIVAVMTRSFGG